ADLDRRLVPQVATAANRCQAPFTRRIYEQTTGGGTSRHRSPSAAGGFSVAVAVRRGVDLLVGLVQRLVGGVLRRLGRLLRRGLRGLRVAVRRGLGGVDRGVGRVLGRLV